MIPGYSGTRGHGGHASGGDPRPDNPLSLSQRSRRFCGDGDEASPPGAEPAASTCEPGGRTLTSAPADQHSAAQAALVGSPENRGRAGLRGGACGEAGLTNGSGVRERRGPGERDIAIVRFSSRCLTIGGMKDSF